MLEPAGDDQASRSASPRNINGGRPTRRAAALSTFAEVDAPYTGGDPQEVRIRASAEGMATVARAVEMLEAALSPSEE